jgi:hypothetical protein
MVIGEKLVQANLLSGIIDDPEYHKGFRTGVNDKQNSKELFACCQIIFAANLVVQLGFVLGLSPNPLYLIFGIIWSCFMNLLWPLCFIRKQTLTKYLFTS